MSKSSYDEQSPIGVAIRSRCPRCGTGHLFRGFLELATRCDICGLDYSFADPADGPAFFVMMTAAVPATGFGIWLELTYSPSIWVHAVTTLPIVLIACIVPLRFFKGWLVATQYIRGAEEGRVSKPADRS
ncbi:DUF983 domain-containing protein [Methylobacterium sp. CM6244]